MSDTSDTSDTVYVRQSDVVWRLAPDRVLIHRVHAAEDPACDLGGAAALVWLALDEPADFRQLADRIADADVEVNAAQLADALRALLHERLVREIPPFGDVTRGVG